MQLSGSLRPNPICRRCTVTTRDVLASLPGTSRRKDNAMSYKDVLARRSIRPVRPERTLKRGGDIVLGNATRPAIIAPGKPGQFAGYLKGVRP